MPCPIFIRWIMIPLLLLPQSGLSQVIDDFTTADHPLNHLNMWRGGQGYSYIGNSVSIDSPGGWWMVSFTNETSSYDLSSKAIKIMYSVNATQLNVIELYPDSLDSHPWTAEIKLINDYRQLIIPLMTAFPNADLKHVHAWAIRGPIVLYLIELVDALEQYSQTVPTVQVLRLPMDISTKANKRRSVRLKTVLIDDFIFNPRHEHSINNLGFVRKGTFAGMVEGGGVYLQSNHSWHEELTLMNRCLDLTGYTIRITYTIAQSGTRFIYLGHKKLLCESMQTSYNLAVILFSSGINQVLDILVSAFIGINPKRIFSLVINGPLIMHRLELIKELPNSKSVAVHASRPVQSPFRLRVDHFASSFVPNYAFDSAAGMHDSSTERDTLNETSSRQGLGMVEDATESLAEFLAPLNQSFDMNGMSFKVTYSTSLTDRRILALLLNLRPPINPLIWMLGKTSKTAPYVVYREVMFFAGTRKITTVPVSLFHGNLSTHDLTKVNGLMIYGPLTIHGIEVVTDQPLPIPTDPTSILPFDINNDVVLEGPRVLIDNFFELLNESVNSLGYKRKTSTSARFRPGQVELKRASHRIDEYISRTQVEPEGIGYLITYSAAQAGYRKLAHFLKMADSERFYDPVERSVYFHQGTNQEIVIPYDVFAINVRNEYYEWVKTTGLTIYGPLTIHKIEFVASYRLRSETHSRIIFQQIQVARNTIFCDAYSQLMNIDPPQLRKHITVVFTGENGIDTGGLVIEFFTLVSLEMSNPIHGLFQGSVDGNQLLYIDPNSRNLTNCSSLFRFVGRFIGMAVIHERLLQVSFPDSFFKVLLKKHVDLTDLKSVEPALYQNLNWVLENNVSDLGLTMSVDHRNADDQMVTVDLIPQGQTVSVTESTKFNYVNLYCQWYLVNRVEHQFDSIRQGITDIIPPGLFYTLTEQDIQRTIGGTVEINVDDWMEHTSYMNCGPSDPFVQLFWECVTEWDNAQRSRLVYFVTGSYRVPYDGFGNLDNGPFTLVMSESSTDHLPKAHTCLNSIELPPYQDKHAMQTKLEYAIAEVNSYEVS